MQITNAYGTLPEGAEVLLLDKQSGFKLESAKACGHCGVSLRFQKVPWNCVEEMVDLPPAGVIDERCNNY